MELSSQQMKGQKMVFPHFMFVSQPILAELGWTSGSHCKPQVYSADSKGGARSGRWAPTQGCFSGGGADTSGGLVGGARVWTMETNLCIAGRELG